MLIAKLNYLTKDRSTKGYKPLLVDGMGWDAL